MTQSPSIDPGALLARTYPLPGGQRVRLRLLRHADAPGVRDLLERVGLTVDDLQLKRLGRFDPRRRAVIAAVSLGAGGESLLGLGSIELGPRSQPELVVIDPDCGEELEGLLVNALLARARRAA